MFRVSLSEGERAELRRRARERGVRPSIGGRLEMVRLCDMGWSVRRIAQHLAVHEQTVRRYMKTYLTHGFDGLAPRPYSGRPPRVLVADLEAVEQLLDESDRTRTVKQLQQLADGVQGTFRNIGRAVTKRLLALGKGLKEDEEKKQATRASVTAEVLTMAEQLVRRARKAQDEVSTWVNQQADRTSGQVTRRMKE